MRNSALIPRSGVDSLPPNWWAVEGPADLIRDNLTNVFDLTPIETSANRGKYRGRNWFVDGQLISLVQTDATIARRNKRQIENCSNLVSIHRYLSGRVLGSAGDLTIDKPCGEVFLTDQALQIELVQTPLLAQSIFIPKHLIGYDSDLHDPFIRFSNNRVVGDLINAEMDRLYAALFFAPELAQSAFRRLTACIKVAIRSPDQDGDVRARARDAMADGICKFIELHLDSPDLSVTTILKNFGVSRASLYRMFEDKGGVREFISDRRLNRAIVEIVQSPQERGIITAAAEKWGFSSNPNFYRAVKRKFGVSPGVLARPACRTTPKGQTVDEVIKFFG